MGRACGTHLAEGLDALETARWDEARVAFEASLAEGETPEALEGLGLAIWFEGRVAEGIAVRERAFEAYAHERRCDGAARMAVWVSHQHLIGGRASAARGWLARAERAVASAGSCAGLGWVAVERARHADSVAERGEHARRAMAIAVEHHDDDLEVFALSVLGRAEVSAGRRSSGLGLLEEAMAAATAGRVRNVHTLAEAYCNLIMACTDAGEWQLAAEWCELVDDFASAYGTTPLLGACRTVHADVLLATGRWTDAERALESALVAHSHYVPEMGAPTISALAELRVRQGRLREAEELLVGREEHPSSLRSLAHLRLAQDEPQVAVALLERGLRGAEGDAVRTMQLLAGLADARLAAGAPEEAEAAQTELRRLATETGMDPYRGRADLAAARIALAAGRIDDAAEAARSALAAFSGLSMPFETAEARVELAQALAETAPEIAREEAQAALAAFRDLAAARGTDRASAVLREIGAGSAGRARTDGELTAREAEVLELLGLGMSNARIAQTLFITEKTASHHVGRILSKLGVRNRAEAGLAAARAARSVPVLEIGRGVGSSADVPTAARADAGPLNSDERNSMQTVADTELKTRHRAMWSSGDYPTMVQTFLLPIGARLAEACAKPGERLLDVAAGTGNASLPAARAGALVTASDLTPRLLDAGRALAEAEGLDLEWTQADAEDLPFEDGSFDTVMSSIGVMFAPHHQPAADEMARVCRPGGTIALLCWTPEGMIGDLFRTMKEFAPPPPPGAQTPPLWGSEDHLRGLFGERVGWTSLERDVLTITAFKRPHDYGEHFKTVYGPTIAARANAAGNGRAAEFDAALNAFCDRWNSGTENGARFEKEYLLALGTRA